MHSRHSIVPKMISYSKRTNVKITIVLVNSSQGRRTGNFVISSDNFNDKKKIDKSGNYTLYTQRKTDGAQVDSKGTRITYARLVTLQWKIVNAIFSIKIYVQCIRGIFALLKIKETPRPSANILIEGSRKTD